jgi:hypothetical protein
VSPGTDPFLLACFAPLAAVPGTEQLRGLAGRFDVVELDGLDAEGGAFLDTSAVMQNLDLVVTADTAAAHLAGGLGVPVWVALSQIADWRWLRDRDDTPWYPTMRLFRQRRLGDWAEVFERMAVELACRTTGRAVRVEVSPGELLDKLSILRIQAERITDPGKLDHVRAELESLVQARAEGVAESAELSCLEGSLKVVNEALWEVEDALRRCERDGDFGPRFVELARAVHKKNDARAALKRQIDHLLGTPFSEQKDYPG